jgi:S-adenosylmethionine-diacylgycerolhomoserine-N-methlytransferase
MDAMYRLTRHIYDATRKPYLLGRDRLLSSMTLPQNAAVLEVGSGTARNLIKLAHSRPDLYLFGIDASNVMLDKAHANLTRAGLHSRITLKLALAQSFDPQSLFPSLNPKPFHAIFFSYSLSMIPQWQDALTHAIEHLAPKGSIHIVDFWDQSHLPPILATPLKHWLALFGVHHRPELLDHLKSLPGSLTLTSHKRRYAYLAKYTPIN